MVLFRWSPTALGCRGYENSYSNLFLFLLTNMELGEAIVCLLSTTPLLCTLLSTWIQDLSFFLKFSSSYSQVNDGVVRNGVRIGFAHFFSHQSPPTRICLVCLCSKLKILLHYGMWKQMFVEGQNFNILFNTIIKCHYLYLFKCCSLKEKMNNLSALLTVLFQILGTRWSKYFVDICFRDK